MSGEIKKLTERVEVAEENSLFACSAVELEQMRQCQRRVRMVGEGLGGFDRTAAEVACAVPSMGLGTMRRAGAATSTARVSLRRQRTYRCDPPAAEPTKGGLSGPVPGMN